MKDTHEIQAELEETRRRLEHVVERETSRDEQDKEPADSETEHKPAEKKHKPERGALSSSRGIETMFRTAYRVQMDLTSLADNKANMMISINGIIMSIIIASVAPKLDANPWLLIPTTILLIGNLISMVYAILAARPRVSSKPLTLEHLRDSEANILFFGNFANMTEDEFALGIKELVQHRPDVYEAMIRNIYGLGSVLKRKFALLQVAYTTFMLALILGVFSFIVVFVWISQR